MCGIRINTLVPTTQPKKLNLKTSPVAHTCSPSIWEAEEDCCEFKVSLDYTGVSLATE